MSYRINTDEDGDYFIMAGDRKIKIALLATHNEGVQWSIIRTPETDVEPDES